MNHAQRQALLNAEHELRMTRRLQPTNVWTAEDIEQAEILWSAEVARLRDAGPARMRMMGGGWVLIAGDRKEN